MSNSENPNRRSREYRYGRSFYKACVIIFASISFVSFSLCILDGFTDERLAMSLINLWFMLFTMNNVSQRFKRKNERFFWHDWKLFASSLKPQQQEVASENISNEENVGNNPHENVSESENNDIKKAG